MARPATAFLWLSAAAILSARHVDAQGEEEGKGGGLANRNLVVVAEEWSPYWTIRTTPDGGEEYGGVLYELLLFIQRARNFNFTVVSSPDGSWGDGGCASAKESVGMMGMAARNEVDLAIGRLKLVKILTVL